MRTLETRLSGPILLAPTVHGDPRGFFVESYRRSALAELGVPDEFVQDNHSRSRRGIVRGMHYQAGQAKLIRCARGSILDVVVDIRRGSPQFGQWEGLILDDEEHHMLYCPSGFAHGFCVLSELADVTYKTSAYYDPSGEGGFAFDDPEVAIQWPRHLELVVSERDRSAPTLAQCSSSLPFVYADG
ncbi:MAG: dTDP-4-dehydrorhamnose 3,5-epimerase [Solirubrobacteraceae bacterium]